MLPATFLLLVLLSPIFARPIPLPLPLSSPTPTSSPLPRVVPSSMSAILRIMPPEPQDQITQTHFDLSTMSEWVYAKTEGNDLNDLSIFEKRWTVKKGRLRKRNFGKAEVEEGGHIINESPVGGLDLPNSAGRHIDEEEDTVFRIVKDDEL